MLKNKFFTILLMLILITPVLAEEPELANRETLAPMSQEQPTETVVSEELPTLDTIPHKEPVSKRKIAKKFLMAMGGVGISSVMLFVILSVYNKIREGFLGGSRDLSSGEETSLVTPDNLTEAVKTFIEKTKWNN